MKQELVLIKALSDLNAVYLLITITNFNLKIKHLSCRVLYVYVTEKSNLNYLNWWNKIG